MARFDWVVFGPETDSVEALYVDKELRLCGDEYHGKTSTAIHYYLCGINDCPGPGIIFNKYFLDDKHPFSVKILEDGKSPPKKFKDLPDDLYKETSEIMPILEKL